MKSIKLNKIDVADIEVLQVELNYFAGCQSLMLDATKKDYFDKILLVDISQKLFYSFRNKIERTSRHGANLILTASESCILLMCCNLTRNRSDHQKHVVSKIGALLHEQLINI